ncbi:MAG: ATP-grasp domain-containing protein [Terracidiphilus sp.]
MRPKVLLATTCRWIASARLAMAFNLAGCPVDIVCPKGHPAALINGRGSIYPYRGLTPLGSFQRAIDAAQPDIVVPCDDLACRHLHEMHARALEDEKNSALCQLIERSLGDPSQYPLIDARYELIALARELDIKVPETTMISSVEELRAWIANIGLPVALKTDGSSGGLGVRIAYSETEAVRSFGILKAPPKIARAVKRAIFDQDRTLLIPCLQRRRTAVSIQRFLPFHDATIAVASWRGEVVASISVEVLRTWKLKGPASVVRIIDNREMLSAAQKLVRHLKLSGLCGFDFLVQRETGDAYLIEMNPRATQTCHLPLGTAHNLPSALIACAAGEAKPESASVTERDVIALFPLEWQNDPASQFLRSGYHDVPWEEPKLVQACVKSRMRNGGWLTYDNLDRMLAHLPWRRS